MSAIEKELYEVVAEEYKEQNNNAAVRFVKQNELSLDYSDLNIMDMSKNLNRKMNSFNPLNKNKLFKTDDEYISGTESLIENVNNFSDYNKFEQSILLDAVVNYNPDMSNLRKFLMSGNASGLMDLFPDMNNYNKRIIGELFGIKK